MLISADQIWPGAAKLNKFQMAKSKKRTALKIILQNSVFFFFNEKSLLDFKVTAFQCGFDGGGNFVFGFVVDTDFKNVTLLRNFHDILAGKLLLSNRPRATCHGELGRLNLCATGFFVFSPSRRR